MFRTFFHSRWRRPSVACGEGRRSKGSKPSVQVLEDRVTPTASLWTDQLDYAPGTMATLYGSGFQPGETIDLFITSDTGGVGAAFPITDGGFRDADAAVDGDGNFTTSWYVDESNANATLTAIAIGQTSGETASTTFTDSGDGTPVNITVANGWTPGGSNGANPATVVTCPTGFVITQIAIKTGGGGGFTVENLTGVPGDENTNDKHSPVIDEDGFLGKGNAFSTTPPSSGPYYSVTGIGTATVTVTGVGNYQPGGGGISHVDYFCGDDNTPGPTSPVTIDIHKFNDLNGDGDDEGGTDPGMVWSFMVTVGNYGPVLVTTNGSGNYSATFMVPVTDLANGIAWSVSEVTQSGWTPTTSTTQGGTFTPTNTSAATTFGNFENIDICGNKFYDHDTDGVDDGVGDEGVAGVRMFLDGDNDGVLDWADSGSLNGVWDPGEGEQWISTDANGDYCLTNLGPGTYVVREDTSLLTGRWVQTTANPAPITVGGTGQQSGEDEEGVNFGNVKLVGSGGLTIGFWRNRNGLNLLSAADFTALNNLPLRDASGCDKDFTGTLTQQKNQFKDWLMNADATNMAYMLSAQLAAMWLNTTVDVNTSLPGVQTAIPSTSAMIYIPGITAHNAQGTALEGHLNSGPSGTLTTNGQVSIQTIIDKAIAALSDDMVDGVADGKVVVLNGANQPGNASRKYYEALKIVLDALNNNDAIVVA